MKVMFAVRDSKAGVYGTPFFAPNEAVACRQVESEVNHRVPENTLANFPDDFELFLLGKFDEDSGAFVLNPAPVSLGNLRSFVRAA